MTVPGLYVSGLSRSGTTLLAAVLDAHPRVHMGYELIPPAGLEVSGLAAQVETLTGEGVQWPRAIGNRIRDLMTPEVGQFVKRTARAGAVADSLVAVLRRFADEVAEVTAGMDERLALARAIVLAHAPPGTAWTGFKAGAPQLRAALGLAAGSQAVTIIRDPRDLAASQVESGMSPDAATVAMRWEAELRQLDALEEATLRIRYEDLVAAPAATIDRLCAALGIGADGAMLRFQEADIGVLVPGQAHANDVALRRGFFSDSVGRWRGQLSHAAAAQVEARCGKRMDELGYELSTPAATGRR